MEKGIYIFENETDFIKAMEQLNHHYKDKHNTIHLSKKIETMEQLRKETKFIDKCFLNTFNGFKKAKQIVINITDGFKCSYCITYFFNGANKGIYGEFHRFLRLKEQSYI